MSMIMIMSIFFMMMTHPIMMLMSIMLLTLYMALIFYKVSQFSLISLIMILLILGGMLIIFMYMVSLSPNNKISLNWMTLVSLPFFMIFLNWETLMENVNNEIIEKIYFHGFMNLILLMMIYLIITLFVVLKLTNSNMSPMKMT
uniref:NADH dehydrogenase subunit 6 n=1 Tax=Haemaphysalis cornigera TaxID=1325867 RepID=A0A976MZ26_9ACAR|nr:NADH dehydrogenase subunit 6 [Haemaphysalis cornigera]YP_011004261.1 NADH dehydrogenase subunit 6 [Haemaphysalis taiwana]UNO53908.1 NADH dehydrogenase subunit 6 [Haemaphysalis cornigera]UNO53921.1 NADH dehydrogenase subunit 6 [Haemaphysalis cornigera]WPS93623.1 NADH dehydrogenase subunit 6 [Haemaphysalis taiwana]